MPAHLKYPRDKTCAGCGKVFIRKDDEICCSRPCIGIVQSKRLKALNPMHRQDVRLKVSNSLKRIGHGPKERGGNGHGPTIPETILSNALGWPIGVVVKTEAGRSSGYPPCYKLDIANSYLKIAIEVDGQSHGTIKRKAQDAKKTGFLESKGWKVLRFTNRQVTENLKECLSTILKLKETITTSQMAS